MISYGYRIVCILVGGALAMLMQVFEPPRDNVVDFVAYETDYTPQRQDSRRESAHRTVLTTLATHADPCDYAQRERARQSVSIYFRARATAIATAEHFPASADAAKVRSSWDEGEGVTVRDAVVRGATTGLYTRADFRPTAPELAALLDPIEPATSACGRDDSTARH